MLFEYQTLKIDSEEMTKNIFNQLPSFPFGDSSISINANCLGFYIINGRKKYLISDDISLYVCDLNLELKEDISQQKPILYYMNNNNRFDMIFEDREAELIYLLTYENFFLEKKNFRQLYFK